MNLVFAALILATLPSFAELVPALSMEDLANSADLIIVGKVVNFQQTGSGDATYNGVNYPRQDCAANISVNEVIKGEPLPHTFILNFSSPSTDAWGNVAQGGVSPNTYGVIFLNKTASGHKFVSPYYPPAFFALSNEDSAAAPFLKAALNIPNVKADPTLRSTNL